MVRFCVDRGPGYLRFEQSATTKKLQPIDIYLNVLYNLISFYWYFESKLIFCINSVFCN